MTDARIIHEDAVRERDQRKVRAGMELSEDIRHANRKYLAELSEADRMYKLRIENHPLPNQSCVLCHGGTGKFCACQVRCGSEHCKVQS